MTKITKAQLEKLLKYFKLKSMKNYRNDYKTLAQLLNSVNYTGKRDIVSIKKYFRKNKRPHLIIPEAPKNLIPTPKYIPPAPKYLPEPPKNVIPKPKKLVRYDETDKYLFNKIENLKKIIDMKKSNKAKKSWNIKIKH